MKRVLAGVLLVLPMVAASATVPEVEITSEPSHHLALENEFVRVFKVEVAPHAATLMHRHRHDYLFVTLGDSRISNEVEGKPAVELALADGDTLFAAGNFAHIVLNLAGKPFRNVTIEFLQDAKLRAALSPWKEGGGEKTFAGGRSKILFVKDGVRVSEVDLDVGATMARHHHDGPRLLVAVSDLDLRSDVEGKGPMPEKLTAGDIKWLPGGYTHTLTNTGDRPARFVTVEFPSIERKHRESGFDQRIAGRDQFHAVKLSGQSFFVGRSSRGGQTLAELGDFLGARAAAANLGTAAGCGHELSPANCKLRAALQFGRGLMVDF